MKPGDTIVAEVDDVRPNGLTLRAEGQTGFINVTNLSWEQQTIDPHAFAKRGETIRVKVYAVTEQGFYASLKALHPENDPFVDLAAYQPGRSHRGVVTGVRRFGTFVRLETAAVGRIEHDPSAASRSLGDTIDVEVVSFDPETTKLELRLRAKA